MDEIEQHIRAIAALAGIEFTRQKFKSWIRNKQHPDRLQIEAIGGRVFAFIDSPWKLSDLKDGQEKDNAMAGLFGIAPRRRKRLVVTVAIGATYMELLSLTRPFFESYSKRCNADYLELTNKTSNQWQMEKFRIYDLALQYDQTLFLDVDCYIRQSCPDIFDMGETMMHADVEHNTWWREWAPGDYDLALASQGLSHKDTGLLLNSGVVLCSRRTAGIWKPPDKPLADTHCSEQWWVQHQSDQFEVTLLPTECNTQYWFLDFEDRLPAAHIIHLANADDRYNRMKEIIRKWT